MPPTPPPEAGAASGTPPAATERGYLITIELTSPSKAAPALVDSTLLKDLMDRVSQVNALKEHKNYYVARAMIVKAQQISSDEARKAILKGAYDTKRTEQE